MTSTFTGYKTNNTILGRYTSLMLFLNRCFEGECRGFDAMKGLKVGELQYYNIQNNNRLFYLIIQYTQFSLLKRRRGGIH